jgi:DNA-binding SARP family transcriptional activator
MLFRILGPVAASGAGGDVPLGGPRHRVLLATLLTSPGRTVPAERLLEALWGEMPPRRAVEMLHVRISELRKLLRAGTDNESDLIVTRRPGYLLDMAADRVDAHRFERAATAARQTLAAGHAPAAAEQLGAALALWRGPVLADLADRAFAQPEITRLENLRAQAIEDRIGAELAAGRHREVIAELEGLVRAHPLHERHRAQLMLGLYREGRQTDALEAYRQAAERLREELGLDPGAQLQQLRLAILRHDPALDGHPPAPAVPAARSAVSQVAVNQVTGSPGAGSGPMCRPLQTEDPFVGRDKELARLTDALEAAAGGRGRLVVVSGDAGIGKSRLVREFTHLAAADGAGVLLGRGWEEGGAPAFWPWIEALEASRTSRPADQPGGLAPSDAAVLAQLLPSWRVTGQSLAEPPPLSAEQARFRLFDTVHRYLARLAEQRPLVVILEDVPHFDGSSAQLLRFVADRVDGTRLLLVATRRDTDPGEAVTGRVLAGLLRGPGCVRLHLSGLAETDTAALARPVAGRELPGPLVTKLHQRTEGNPLYLHEVLHLLGEHPKMKDRIEHWVPAGLAAAVHHRLGGLPEAVRVALEVAAVAGRSFLPEVVAAAGSLEREALLELLDQATAAGFVEPDPAAAGAWRFSHMLVRDALYQRLGPGYRARLHVRIARVLEDPRRGRGLERASVIAQHYLLGASAADPEVVCGRLAAAGAAALRLLAYEEAARLYRLAVDHAPDASERLEALLGLGAGQTKAGEVAEGRRCYQQAAQLAEESGAAEPLARAALGYGELPDYGRVNPTLVALLRHALAALPPNQVRLRAQLLARLARELSWADPRSEDGAPAYRAALVEEAGQLAESAGDAALLVTVLHARINALWGPENLEEREELVTRMMRMLAANPQPKLRLHALAWQARNSLERGDLAAVDEAIAEYTAIAQELRQPSWRFWVMLWRGMRALMAGDFATTEHLLQKAQALACNHPMFANAIAAQLGVLCMDTGRLAEAEQLVRRRAEDYPEICAWRLREALMDARQGRIPQAAEKLDILAHADFRDLRRDDLFIASLSLLAELCVLVGDRARARLVHDLLAPYADRCVVYGGGAICTGAVARFLGDLAALLGRSEAAAAHYERALDVNRRLGAEPALAHTEFGYGGLLLVTGTDVARGRSLLAGAAARAQGLGMPCLASRIAQTLRDTG